jgi:hypothetical protein
MSGNKGDSPKRTLKPELARYINCFLFLMFFVASSQHPGFMRLLKEIWKRKDMALMQHFRSSMDSWSFCMRPDVLARKPVKQNREAADGKLTNLPKIEKISFSQRWATHPDPWIRKGCPDGSFCWHAPGVRHQDLSQHPFLFPLVVKKYILRR